MVTKKRVEPVDGLVETVVVKKPKTTKKATKKKTKRVAKKTTRVTKTIPTATTGIVLPADFAPRRKPSRKRAPKVAPVRDTDVIPPETTVDVIAEVAAKELDTNKDVIEARRKILEIMEQKPDSSKHIVDLEQWEPVGDPINVFESKSWFGRMKEWLSTLIS